jgi:hypothetical protein
MEAAKRAGATRRRSDCIMKGPRAQRSFVERRRPMKPTVSTGGANASVFGPFGRVCAHT